MVKCYLWATELFSMVSLLTALCILTCRKEIYMQRYSHESEDSDAILNVIFCLVILLNGG